MTDLFLSLKYKGVRTPWEIMVNPTQYGWSCRKWLRHQSDAADKAALKAFADALINDGKILTNCLPQINLISERVQRWRKDQEAYSLEPDERSEFKDLRRLVDVVRSNPAAMPGVLLYEFSLTVPEEFENDLLPELFKASAVIHFLGALKKSPPSFSSPPDIIQKANEIVREAFLVFGYSDDKQNHFDLIDQFLIEIDIDPNIKVPSYHIGTIVPPEQLVFIEKFTGSKREFVRCEYRQGKVFVSANQDHCWLAEVGIESETVMSLLHAIGDAYLARLGTSEVVEDFLAELGMSLSRRISN